MKRTPRNVPTAGCGCRLQDTAVGRGRTQEKLQTFVQVAERK